MPKIKHQNTQASNEGWENKWKCAVEMAAIAEIQRDDLEYKLTNAKQSLEVAIEDADHWKSEYEIVVSRLCGVKHERDNGIIFEHEIIPKLERERDEARTELEMWRDGNILHEIHRNELEKVERERDKWEETARLYCKNSEFNREMREKVEQIRSELDQIKEDAK